MKRLILILFLLIPLTGFSLSWNCKDPVLVEKYILLDPVQGIDFVFSILGSEIKQVGVINYFEFSIVHLKNSLRVKSTQTAGEETDPPDQRRKYLDEMIRESWPGVGRLKYFEKK